MSDTISTSDDFRKQATERALEAPETITLPSGLVCQIRRPKPLWWVLNRGTLPDGMVNAALGEPRQEGSSLTSDEAVQVANTMRKLIEDMVIDPRIRNNPKPGEVDPAWIDNADLSFLIKVAGGEITADGADLSTFPGQSESSTPGAGGGSVEDPTEQSA